MRNLIKLVTKKDQFAIRSQGKSMLPLLYPDDILFFNKIKFYKIRINDLVLVNKDKKVFTHRVIYKTLKYFTSKGDNNLVSDGKIFPNQIIGRVYQVKRNGQLFNPETFYLAQSTHYIQEIVEIKQALEKEKIDIIFMKGLPLHLYLEKSHPRRIYADCDVLIKPENLNKVEKILIRYGYQSTNTSYSSIHKILKDKPTEIMFIKKLNGFPVIFDVHFEINFLMNQLGKMNELYPQDLIDKLTKDCIDSRKLITITNYQFSILHNEFLILYLALHIFHHNFRGAFRLEFLDKVIKKTILTSSPRRSTSHTSEVFLSLTDNITKYRLQNFVYPVFLLLKKYYSTTLPAKFLDSIKPDEGKMKYILGNILNINIFDDETRIAAGVARFKNLFFLSPNPLWRRLMIIFNLQVIYSVLWVMIFFFRRSAGKLWYNLKL